MSCRSHPVVLHHISVEWYQMAYSERVREVEDKPCVVRDMSWKVECECGMEGTNEREHSPATTLAGGLGTRQIHGRSGGGTSGASLIGLPFL